MKSEKSIEKFSSANELYKNVSENLKLWDYSDGTKIIAPISSSGVDLYFILDNACFLIPEEQIVINEEDGVITQEFVDHVYVTSDKFVYMDFAKALNILKNQTMAPLSNQINELQNSSNEIREYYTKVNDIINDIHGNCKILKGDQLKYTKLLDYINNTLEVFERINNMQERLGDNINMPYGYENLITIFDQIYNDMQYLRERSHYKEAPMYLAKCWNHAYKILTVIKARVFKIIDDAFIAIETTEINPSSFIEKPNTFVDASDDMFVCFYARFRGHITERCKAFVYYLEEWKTSKNAFIANNKELAYTHNKAANIPIFIVKLDLDKEVASILTECKEHYITRREKLLFPVVRNTMDDLMGKHITDHCNLVRNATNFFSNLYNDETNLYHHIFAIATPEFGKYTERLCNIMYDALRGRVVRIKHLETLTELCSVLLEELNCVGPIASINISENDNVERTYDDHANLSCVGDNHNSVVLFAGTSTTQPQATHEKDSSAFEGSGGTFNFNDSIERLLGDVRERLVFITHIYVENDIRKYNPSSGDLAYPAKLKMIKDISESIQATTHAIGAGGTRDNSICLDYHNNFLNPSSSICLSNLKSNVVEKNFLKSFSKDIESLDVHSDRESMASTIHNDISRDLFVDDSSTITEGSLSEAGHRKNNQSVNSKELKHPRGRSSSFNSDKASSRFNYSTVSTATSSQYAHSPYELYGLWYPTVRRAIACLSKLNRCLDKSVFKSLSQDVLDACLNSLLKASSLVKDTATLLDSQLFLMKHLLILREQIAPFQTRFSQKEVVVDFPNVKDVALKMFQQRIAILSFSKTNSFLEFILNTAPTYHEQYLDSKKLVDLNIKIVCQAFIKTGTCMLVGSVDSYIEKHFKHLPKYRSNNIPREITNNIKLPSDILSGEQSTILNFKESLTNINDPTKNLPSTKDLSEFTATAYRFYKDNAKFIKTSLSLYLANPDTEFILFRPIKTNAQISFCKFRDFVQLYYTTEEQSIIQCPSFEQVSLVLNADDTV